MTGRVVHFEIPFEDRDRAKRFYSDVFHWQVEEMPELDYVGVQTGPAGQDGMASEPGYIGGGMTARAGSNTATVIVLDSTDIDADLSRVESHGGEVLEGRTPVGDMGFAAYFKDSEGNVVGLWQNA
ncbi:VOC family protein [Georgenia satyanarayanai]|uniref:VOC family protein n=1 Tax=Georgenia satyanarayanai TaxID=860221 RepID=UPI00203F24C9|nr:VOC family protein [Georgenia satyanarayanai]MCM3662016.1 VOC family protein [Georgenia satyanarayanai]